MNDPNIDSLLFLCHTYSNFLERHTLTFHLIYFLAGKSCVHMRSIDQTLTPRAVPRYENSTLFQKSWVEPLMHRSIPSANGAVLLKSWDIKKLEKKHIGSCVHARTRFIAEVLWLLRWDGSSFKFHARVRVSLSVAVFDWWLRLPLK